MERVNSVGSVFPVFFMLVAILVCVTTMSRLVEEQRGDVGALTTLGYRPIHIISKYIAYSASATVVGSILGAFVMFKLGWLDTKEEREAKKAKK